MFNTEYKLVDQLLDHLRSVQTQAILFLKSLSERGGYIDLYIDLETIEIKLMRVVHFSTVYELSFELQSRSMSDPTITDIDFQNKMAWVSTTLELQ